ncbi:hypothetical protein [Microbacterium sp. 2FI]|uniref:hypothetical protein n=1 Tax=Microbacterium sp. 2FI TaxID=2502193 RepID=UPI0010F6A0D9|nr:hypothetical protein [Microbacterium sp. 2FI]
MSWLDEVALAEDGMSFAHGDTVYRDRRPLMTDPYNPDATVPGAWSDADTLVLTEAFVDDISSSTVSDGARSAISSGKALFLTDPDADVQVGDRIRAGDLTLYVNELPSSPKNPFTGWRPGREVPLDHTLG